MSEANTVNVSVGQDLVAPIIQAKIEAAIVQQLGKEANLVERLVASALTQKVNSRGRVSDRCYENKHSFLALICEQAIHDAARQALEEYINENKPKIVDAMKKQLRASPAKMAKALIDGVSGSMQSKWSWQVKIANSDD